MGGVRTGVNPFEEVGKEVSRVWLWGDRWDQGKFGGLGTERVHKVT
jgi:hypothetical protein